MKYFRISIFLLLCGFISNNALAARILHIPPVKGVTRYLILAKYEPTPDFFRTFSPESTTYFHKVEETDPPLLLVQKEDVEDEQYSLGYHLVDWSLELKKVVGLCPTGLATRSSAVNSYTGAFHDGKYSIHSDFVCLNVQLV